MPIRVRTLRDDAPPPTCAARAATKPHQTVKPANRPRNAARRRPDPTSRPPGKTPGQAPPGWSPTPHDTPRPAAEIDRHRLPQRHASRTSWRRPPRTVSTASRSSTTTCSPSTARPKICRRIAEDLGLDDLIFGSRSATSRRCPSRSGCRATSTAPSASSTSCRRLARTVMLVCSNVHPRRRSTTTARRRRPARTGGAGRGRGLRVGLRGIGLGPARQPMAPCLADRQSRRPPGARPDSGQFPHAGARDDPSGIDRVPADKLFFVQLADAPELSMDVLSWSRHFRNFPGQGSCRSTAFVRAVLDAGYAVRCRWRSSTTSSAPRRHGSSRATACGRCSWWKPRRPPPNCPPDRHDSPAFEFLEFAVTTMPGAPPGRNSCAPRIPPRRPPPLQIGRTVPPGASQPDPESRTRQCGRQNIFSCMDHRSARWRSVSMMPARAIASAPPRCCRPEWHERTGAGERKIPAVRAPDGTLIFLVQPVRPQHSGRLPPVSGTVAASVARQPRVARQPSGARQPPRRRCSTAIVDSCRAGAAGGPDGQFRAVLQGGVRISCPSSFGKLPDPYGLVRSRAMVSAGRHHPPAAEHLGRPGNRDRPFYLHLMPAPACTTSRWRRTIFWRPCGTWQRAARRACRSRPTTTTTCRALGTGRCALAQLARLDLLYDRDDEGDYLQAYTDRVRRPLLLRNRAAAAAISSSVRPMPRCGWRPRPSVVRIRF